VSSDDVTFVAAATPYFSDNQEREKMLFLFWFFDRATPFTWRVEGSITKWMIHQRPPHYTETH
jgi:hypothetical protein